MQSWPTRQQISTATPSSSASTKTTFPRYGHTCSYSLTLKKHCSALKKDSYKDIHSQPCVQCGEDTEFESCMVWRVYCLSDCAFCMCVFLENKTWRVVLRLWDCSNFHLFLFSLVSFHPVFTLVVWLLLKFDLFSSWLFFLPYLMAEIWSTYGVSNTVTETHTHMETHTISGFEVIKIKLMWKAETE